MARGRSCVLALLACAGVAGAFPIVAGAQDDGARLGIIVCDAARVPAETLATAQRAAARVFAKAGVDVEWLGCTGVLVADAKDVEDQIACHRPRHTDRLVLEILPHAGAAAHLVRDVGGFARVSGNGQGAGCAGVFYARATDLARLGDASAAQILAHLIAHEIGHLLLGARSHSQRGIMRPEWSRADMARAAWGQLTFEPSETERLRAGLLVRVARSVASRE